MAKAGSIERAREIGDLLGDLLSDHLGRYEDELADALTNSLGKEKALSEAQLAAAKKEALAYVSAAIEPILRKATSA